MIEKTIYDYLSSVLSVPVYLERPETKPTAYVLIEKTGGTKKNHLSNSMFAFQSYHETLYKAAELNNIVKQAVEEMPAETDVVSVYLNGDYNFTNSNTKEYRYQAVYMIRNYE